MQTNPTLQRVIDHNRAILSRARALNARFDTPLFLVMDRDGLSAWILERLGGARKVSEIRDPEAIRLPELDQSQVDRVLSECPDEITVLDERLAVEYREGFAPQVRLTDDMVKANRWSDLPDAGITTPGGRSMEVIVKISYGDTISGADIPRLKSRMRNHLNEGLWSRWQQPDGLSLPDWTQEDATIPAIIECVYGHCVVTGVALVAYGVVAVNRYRSWNSTAYFQFEWTRDQSEAQTRHAEAVAKLAELRVEFQEKDQVEAEMLKAEAAKEKLFALYKREDEYKIGGELNTEMNRRLFREYIPTTDLEAIQAWTTQARELTARVEQAFADVVEREAQEERQRLADEEAERVEMEVILPLVEGSLFRAREVLSFAKAVESSMGASKGAQLLYDQLTASYGRARRQEALKSAIPFLVDSDAGRILTFTRASDVDLFLNAAMAWLESQVQTTKSASEPTATAQAPTSDQTEKSGGLNLGALASNWGANVR